MPDIRRKELELILGRSLLTVEATVGRLRPRIARLAAEFGFQAARNLLEDMEPVFAQMFADTQIASWVAGANELVEALPPAILEALSATVPGETESLFEDRLIRFPTIEKAAKRLQDLELLPNGLVAGAESEGFAVAGVTTERTLEKIRSALVESVSEGLTFEDTSELISDTLEESAISPAHFENVYRTNIQRAFHDAREELARLPIVSDLFPYREYLAVHDDRARENHLALESLGLNGTGVYRANDPMWQIFLPPWDFQCRCTTNILTVEAAARRGVREAVEWDRTGIEPQPEFRISEIPFRATSGFVR